ncbi:MAG TPA: ADP-ribosylglycohydrolase family protein [Bacilli bacterium]|nr:ADP-ribosylglycohydrolase family protein [Bacilli bacterium]
MSKYVDSIIGHAVGDAMGVPTEFCLREKLLENPVKKMISSDKVGQPAGTWSDDTSMEIATIDSYIQNNDFNYHDIMQKWVNWIDKADYTGAGEVFDVGRTCLTAIRRFMDGINPVECGLNNINSNGNGSLMRILPVALYSYSKKLNNDEIVKLVNDISSLTHGHEISKLGCYIYVKYVINLLNGLSKEEAYEKIKRDNYSYYSDESLDAYSRILKNNIKDYTIDEINSSGYVVDTLECSFWILLNASTYREAIIASTNIGQDTDTIGAITGSMAGIIYGVNSIPENWLNELQRKDYLIDLALNFERKTNVIKKDVILGTIIGDIAGSRFELVSNKYGKNFVLLHEHSRYSDDSVMTLAVAQALLNSKDDFSDIEKLAIESMVSLGRKYPACGYGPSFYKWIMSDEHKPYGSFGNGSAMRISSVGVVGKNINEIKKLASAITNVSHNHPDSINGAEATAIAIRMSLDGKSKDEIKTYIEENYFKIDDLKIDSMKPQYFHINCIETVKQALSSFIDSYDFEDAIRNAIALGGDSDTIGAITGSIAAAYYGIPDYICEKALKYLDSYLIGIHDDFINKYQ